MSIGGRRSYNKSFEEKDNVILWDVFPVKNGETVLLTFESKNSEWLQGVWLMCDMGIEVDGIFNRSVMLWYETASKQVNVKCHTNNGLLNIYNIWDRGYGPNSQSHSSGMVIEEIPKGRRYKCNDIGLQTIFDKLVFKIEHIT
jgi:hypothetical protein